MNKDQNLGAMSATLGFIKDSTKEIKNDIKDIKTMLENKVDMIQFKEEIRSIREEDIKPLKESTMLLQSFSDELKGRFAVIGVICMVCAGMLGSLITNFIQSHH